MYLKGVCSSAYFDLVFDVTNYDTSIGYSGTGRKASSARLHAVLCPAAQSKFLTPNSDGGKPTQACLLAQLVPWPPRMSQPYPQVKCCPSQGRPGPALTGSSTQASSAAPHPLLPQKKSQCQKCRKELV